MKKVFFIAVIALLGTSLKTSAEQHSSQKNTLEFINTSKGVDKSTLSFELNSSSKVSIEIFDLQGKLIKTIKQNEVMNSGKHTIHIDLSQLKKGSYFRKLTVNGLLNNVEIINIK